LEEWKAVGGGLLLAVPYVRSKDEAEDEGVGAARGPAGRGLGDDRKDGMVCGLWDCASLVTVTTSSRSVIDAVRRKDEFRLGLITRVPASVGERYISPDRTATSSVALEPPVNVGLEIDVEEKVLSTSEMSPWAGMKTVEAEPLPLRVDGRLGMEGIGEGTPETETELSVSGLIKSLNQKVSALIFHDG
jgi:hypothetical protein